MLFASDLDGTLIYSRRFQECLAEKEKIDLRLIEVLNGKEISFVSEAIINKLKTINEKLIFVPSTTRSIMQYKRIELFHEEVKISYAVVSNGGNILKNGEPMAEWQELIQKELKKNPLGREDILKKFFTTEGSQWVLSIKEVDDLFHYCILDREKIKREDFIPFFNWLRDHHWTGSLQGRKLYLIPNCINKRDPILFLMKKLRTEDLVAAGDSFLDLPMLRAARRAIIPYHGELVESFGATLLKEKIKYTSSSGVAAGEEILDFVINLSK